MTPTPVTLTVQSPRSLPDPAAVVTLLKPVTWFAPMWALGCGVVASGVSLAGQSGQIALGVLVAGPLVCGASQAVNDWFDRHVDAINEPQRPIPSGRIPGRWGLGIAIAWSLLAALVGMLLGPAGAIATAIGLALAWAYSAPPLRLKADGWWGNLACGMSYEGIAWVTGHALMLGGAIPGARSLALAACYSIGAHGIMTLNDFKAIEGDRAMGIRSLPVRLGPDTAALLACAVMLGAQIVAWFVALPVVPMWARLAHAALILVQPPLMLRWMAAPRDRAPWYNGTGVLAFVLGMLVSAFGLRAGGAAW